MLFSCSRHEIDWQFLIRPNIRVAHMSILSIHSYCTKSTNCRARAECSRPIARANSADTFANRGKVFY